MQADYVFRYSLEFKQLQMMGRTTGSIKSLTVDKSGNLFVCDGDYEIKQIDKEEHSTVISPANDYMVWDSRDGELGYAQFSSLTEIVWAHDSIYCLDDWSIRRIHKDFVSTLLPYKSTDQYDLPLCICLDITGNLILSTLRLAQDVSKMKCYPQDVLICTDAEGDFYLSANLGIYKIENLWKWERLLWIGHLKEKEHDCLFAIVPKDILKEIARCLRESETILSIPTFVIDTENS